MESSNCQVRFDEYWKDFETEEGQNHLLKGVDARLQEMKRANNLAKRRVTFAQYKSIYGFLIELRLCEGKYARDVVLYVSLFFRSIRIHLVNFLPARMGLKHKRKIVILDKLKLKISR